MSYPILTWLTENNVDAVRMDGKNIFEIRDGRYLRFTAKPGDEKWFGTKQHGIDIGWSFQDYYTQDYKPGTQEFINHPENGYFEIVMHGGKNVMDCLVDTVVKGEWQEEEQSFRYALDMRWRGNLEELYQKSSRCIECYGRDPKGPSYLEMTDYFIPNISLMDIHDEGEGCPFPRPIYPYFVMSTDGEKWVHSPMAHLPELGKNSPKVHIPDFNIAVDKERSLINYPSCYGENGSFFGFADPEFGGWLIQTLDAPKPIRYTICWYYYDIHVGSPDGIPPRGSQETFDLHYACSFIPVTAERGKAMIDSARDYDWRSGHLYDTPLFTYDGRLDRNMKDFPAESIKDLNFWHKTDENYCYMDHELGYGSNHSLMIVRPEGLPPKPDAWYNMCWGLPYDCVIRLGRRFRMSAMIKTEGATGRARIGKVSRATGGDVFYGINTHYKNGECKPVGGSMHGNGMEVDLYWAYSESLTGDNDWTKVQFEFNATEPVIDVFCEMDGSGKCWFSDIRIEDIGPAVRTFFTGTHSQKQIQHAEKYGPYCEELRKG